VIPKDDVMRGVVNLQRLTAFYKSKEKIVRCGKKHRKKFWLWGGRFADSGGWQRAGRESQGPKKR